MLTYLFCREINTGKYFAEIGCQESTMKNVWLYASTIKKLWIYEHGVKKTPYSYGVLYQYSHARTCMVIFCIWVLTYI